jgi:hypothetical protein
MPAAAKKRRKKNPSSQAEEEEEEEEEDVQVLEAEQGSGPPSGPLCWSQGRDCFSGDFAVLDLLSYSLFYLIRDVFVGSWKWVSLDSVALFFFWLLRVSVLRI